MKTKSDKKRVFVNTIIVSGATIVDKFLFFVINIIVARYLTLADFGEYSTALGYATFFSIFVSIGINQALVRAVNLEPEHESEHFGNTLILKSCLAVVIYSLMLCTLLFSNYNHNTIILIVILGIVRIGNEYLMAFYALFDAKERFTLSSMLNMMFSSAFLAGTVGVVLCRGNYFHIADVRLAVVVFFIVMNVAVSLKYFPIKPGLKRLKGFIANAVPFAVYSVFSNIIQRVNIIILSMMCGTLSAGIFNNAIIFFSTLVFIPTSFSRVLVPYLYKAYSTSDSAKIQFAFDLFSRVFGIISFYLLVVFFLYSEHIVTIIYGSKYQQSIPVLRIAAIAIPCLFNIAAIVITVIDRQHINTRILGYATIANLVANIVCIHLWQASGAAMATLITYLVIFILSHGYLMRIKIVKLRKTIINYIVTSLVSIAAIVLGLVGLGSMHYMISFLIISLFFFAMIALLLVRKDDIRILMETVGMK